jgi:hypothetical protein
MQYNWGVDVQSGKDMSTRKAGDDWFFLENDTLKHNIT